MSRSSFDCKTSGRASSRWPNRLAWLLACATFPMIWMGGLVTTYDAGMAVPDWPNTFGHNLVLYPINDWLAVWDVFLEHGHRLLGIVVGTIAAALAVVLWLRDERAWTRWLGVAALGGVCLQGLLGGLRVLGDEVLLAMVHGCTAPLVFALATSAVAVTSQAWRTFDVPVALSWSGWTRRLTLTMTIAIYLQIVLGAQMRHVLPDSETGWFTLWLWLHLIVAGLIELGAIWLLVLVRSSRGNAPIVMRRAWLLLALVLTQVILGAATWVTNFGWPAWFTDWIWAVDYTVVSEGRLQAVTTTLHVAVGALSLATALSLTWWARRFESG